MGIFDGLFFRKRKHERFLVCDGSFVIVTPDKNKTDWVVNVIDISLGGLAFIYPGTPEQLEETGFIKMFKQSTKDGKLKYKTVFDAPTQDNKYRKRGVKFEWFGSLSEEDLKTFIKEKSLICK